MTHLSLFSGIGGIDLAAEWAGFTTVAFVEKDKFCQQVLAKNFPGVPIYDDVRTFNATQFRGVSLVTGGFPCQDLSQAGKQAGLIEGKRSILWFEMLRVVQECRPLFVLAENVPGIRTKGIDRVLYGLEEAGYTAEPFVVGAGSAGAPHIRKRCFIVGWNANGHKSRAERGNAREVRGLSQAERESEYGATLLRGTTKAWGLATHASGKQPRDTTTAIGEGRGTRQVGATAVPYLPWAICEPPVPGVVARIPRWLDSIRALGNAVVPQQVYPILEAIANQLRCAV